MSLVSIAYPVRPRFSKNTLALDVHHATNENAYLSEPLHDLIVNKLNEDATELFHTVFRNKEDKESIRGYVLHGMSSPVATSFRVSLHSLFLFPKLP